ncbi:hypothetical protein M440DRAFT_1145192 [Trichoderma longibrachiatum ATCC 18648]|uniref:Uncharacterized protein n=1 Tax=Trichoderma longibrachiatum ATCC 18648 TaxID=983965 RepID=A0A2T4BQU5_TRILO|nr:hypothetical protein M440DRAFT_1145192 [Trichoderma longibrachiatum ATCC 18648]
MLAFFSFSPQISHPHANKWLRWLGLPPPLSQLNRTASQPAPGTYAKKKNPPAVGHRGTPPQLSGQSQRAREGAVLVLFAVAPCRKGGPPSSRQLLSERMGFPGIPFCWIGRPALITMPCLGLVWGKIGRSSKSLLVSPRVVWVLSPFGREERNLIDRK